MEEVDIEYRRQVERQIDLMQRELIVYKTLLRDLVEGLDLDEVKKRMEYLEEELIYYQKKYRDILEEF